MQHVLRGASLGLPNAYTTMDSLRVGMGAYVVSEVVKLMIQKRIHVADADVLVLGLAFKENCPDIRNTRVIDIVNEMQSYGANVDVYDPLVDSAEVQSFSSST